MATSISGIPTSNAASVSSTNQLHAASAAKAAASSVGAAGIVKDDTVKISMAASIKLMRHQGLSPSIIASRLGMSLKQVDTYIPGSSQTTSTPAISAPASSGGSPQSAKEAPAASNETPETAPSTPSGKSAPALVPVPASTAPAK